MEGHEHLNHPAFDEATAWLRSKGWEVVSPAEIDRELGMNDSYSAYPDGHTREDVMRRDLHEVTAPDMGALFLLPGWVNFRGARDETETAIVCGLDLYLYQPQGVFEDEAFNLDHRLVAVSPAVAEFMMKESDQPDGVVTSETGGKKAQKLIRYDLIPSEALEEVALCYGLGAKKYGDWNWRLGYDLSLSVAALERHLHAWKQGEEDDEEGFKHLAAVVFHTLTLIYRDKMQIGVWDDFHG